MVDGHLINKIALTYDISPLNNLNFTNRGGKETSYVRASLSFYCKAENI